MDKQILSQLKEYSPKDFKQWKETGLTKIFFDYLKDKDNDIQKMVLADFVGGAFMKDRLPIYERRQAFSACLRDCIGVQLEDLIDYYEALNEREGRHE